MNKYVTGYEHQKYYPTFLKSLQDSLSVQDIELQFVLFSDNMKNVLNCRNIYSYNPLAYEKMTQEIVEFEAGRIETNYEFTIKQAWFPDIIQASKSQNTRRISVPSEELNDLNPLVKKFLFLEGLVKDNRYDILFSDGSPEVEMEFGRAIGLKLGIPIIKSYEGSFLGRTALLRNTKFGKYSFIESDIYPEVNADQADRYISNYIQKKAQPSYVGVKKNIYSESLWVKIQKKFKRDKINLIGSVLKIIIRALKNVWLTLESSVFKIMLYSKFNPDQPYLFFGLHLGLESTVVLRSQPYTNQISLIEMLSRVLPYGYKLYVREHPHWPKRFSYSYLKKANAFPNVKLLSPKHSIHEILTHAKGILVYNSNTGIESLFYDKPVLSFSDNLYYGHHPAVSQCSDLFELGEHLAKLINTKVSRKDTIQYVRKMLRSTVDMSLGSDYFISEEDANQKAEIISNMIAKSVEIVMRNE